MSNLGYARGISGTLGHHVRYAHRHVFCSQDVQKEVLRQLRELIAQFDPDLCCFAEIDNGSFSCGGQNQLEQLIDRTYPYFDIENKYGQTSRLRDFFLTKGKSNAFIAKHAVPFAKLYFPVGGKRLVYRFTLAPGLELFFAHFSLSKPVRRQQLLFMKELAAAASGDVVLLGDFNILTGFKELSPLLSDNRMVVLNQEDRPTFNFHRLELALDLCICSAPIAKHVTLHIIPQPYSDHAALLIELPLKREPG